LLTISPNLIWNAANNFATVGHTADNANLSNTTYSVMNLVTFFTNQMGVFGPITLILLIIGSVTVFPKTNQPSLERWLLAFVLPPIVVIAAIAFLSRAHANWAASAYPAASVLLAALISRTRWWTSLKIALGLNLIVGLLLTVLSINQNLATDMGMSNSFKRVRGWETTTSELDAKAKEFGATAIVFDEREIWHGMDYYKRLIDRPVENYMWQRHNSPHAFAESYAPIPEGQKDTYLIATIRPGFVPIIRQDFESLEHVGRVDIDLNGGKVRSFCLYTATNFKMVERTQAYEDSLKGAVEPCPSDIGTPIPYQ
jgi:hypothetical protein